MKSNKFKNIPKTTILFTLVMLLISCKSSDNATTSESSKDSGDSSTVLSYSIETKANGSGSKLDSIQLNVGESIDLYSIIRNGNSHQFKENFPVTWGLNGSIGSLTISGQASSTTFNATTAGQGEIYMVIKNKTHTIPVRSLIPALPSMMVPV